MSHPYREITGMSSDFGSIGRRLDVLVDFAFNVDQERFYATEQKERDVYSGYYLSETTDFLILRSFSDGQKIQKIQHKDEGEVRKITTLPLAYRELLIQKERIFSVETHFNDEQTVSQPMRRDGISSDLKGKTIDVLLGFIGFVRNQTEVQGDPLRYCSNNYLKLGVHNGKCIEVTRRFLVIDKPHERYLAMGGQVSTSKICFYKTSSINLEHVLAIGVLE